jgi:hypothetical protein
MSTITHRDTEALGPFHARQSIAVRYFPCTNTRPPYLVAKQTNGPCKLRVSLGKVPHIYQSDEQRAAYVAAELARALGWAGNYYIGGTAKIGEYLFVQACPTTFAFNAR